MSTITKKQQDLEKEIENNLKQMDKCLYCKRDMEEFSKPCVAHDRNNTELLAELSGITFAKEEMLKDEISWLKSLNQNDIREITKDIRISQLQLELKDKLK